MIIALEKEMKKVEALLTKKQTQLKMLLQEDLQIDLDLIDKVFFFFDFLFLIFFGNIK